MIYQVAVNLSKSTFILRHSPCPRIFLYGIPIPYSSKIKYFGLTLDQRITWPFITSKLKDLALNHRHCMLKPLSSNNKYTSIRT